MAKKTDSSESDFQDSDESDSQDPFCDELHARDLNCFMGYEYLYHLGPLGPHLHALHISIASHCGKLGQYSTGAVGRAASSGLEGFGYFGRLHYRIKEGGHLPYEG